MMQATIDHLYLIISAAGPHPLRKPTNVEDFDRIHVNLVDKMLDIPIPLNKVKVKESSIHGRGVFAKQKINKGELITIYPAHYVSIHPSVRGKPGYSGLRGSALTEKLGTILTEAMRRSYAYDVSKYYVIYGIRILLIILHSWGI